jgi:hypothetical protein
VPWFGVKQKVLVLVCVVVMMWRFGESGSGSGSRFMGFGVSYRRGCVLQSAGDIERTREMHV